VGISEKYKLSITRARVVWGKCYNKSVSDDFTPKKSSLLKIFGSNLLLKNRILVSTPTTPYASLREARLKFSENDFGSYLVALYDSILTHFTQNR
jgi:hypothetical protein